ncbi:heavy-metal-associated domain-containing protein [Martelella alba]|uniref:Heavy-metal-associated domain-containing protein n=1 Tax=Martelella alba TaxID=2590451 RepID=A0A506UE10_9HYPH|nr:heavy metal-associated domain-containing protein [Martelella alba]TPW32190.1 heavy-metal-associated domain-containing protein [Martelella alba]
MTEKMTLSIDGMGCSKCVEKVEKALSAIDGISGVSVNLEGKSASFELASPASRDQAVEAVEDSGYDVVG